VNQNTRGFQSLARSLSGSSNDCPIPSAHDKLAEAHYFIHDMLGNYHRPHEFRYSLSGFLQAARSTTLMLQSELRSRAGFDDWYAGRRQHLSTDADLRLLNRLRVRVVHQNSLVPASSMFAGYLKYRRPKLGFQMPLNPMMDTLAALVETRRVLGDLPHPHRIWIGEELGIQRKWSLAEIEGRELVQFCMDCWKKISVVIVEAHSWCGADLEPQMTCGGEVGEAQLLTESEVFPEVARAWDESPTEIVSPRENELPLLNAPLDSADRLHVITAPASAKGWVTVGSPYWSSEYASMLVHSIGDSEVNENTCVFFEHKKAFISVAPQEDEHEEETEQEEDKQ
jgi:hypothetical protein